MDISISILYKFNFYNLAEGIMNSARSFQSIEGDVSDPIKYTYSWSASLDESI